MSGDILFQLPTSANMQCSPYYMFQDAGPVEPAGGWASPGNYGQKLIHSPTRVIQNVGVDTTHLEFNVVLVSDLPNSDLNTDYRTLQMMAGGTSQWVTATPLTWLPLPMVTAGDNTANMSYAIAKFTTQTPSQNVLSNSAITNSSRSGGGHFFFAGQQPAGTNVQNIDPFFVVGGKKPGPGTTIHSTLSGSGSQFQFTVPSNAPSPFTIKSLTFPGTLGGATPSQCPIMVAGKPYNVSQQAGSTDTLQITGLSLTVGPSSGPVTIQPTIFCKPTIQAGPVTAYGPAGSPQVRPTGTASATNYDVYDASAPFCEFTTGYPPWKSSAAASFLGDSAYDNVCGPSSSHPCLQGAFFQGDHVLSNTPVTLGTFSQKQPAHAAMSVTMAPQNVIKHFNHGCEPGYICTGSTCSSCDAENPLLCGTSEPDILFDSPPEGYCCKGNPGSYYCHRQRKCHGATETCDPAVGVPQPGLYIVPESTFVSGKYDTGFPQAKTVFQTPYAFSSDKGGDNSAQGKVLACPGATNLQSCAQIAAPQVALRSGEDALNARCPVGTKSILYSGQTGSITPDPSLGTYGGTAMAVCVADLHCTDNSQCDTANGSTCSSGGCTCTDDSMCQTAGSGGTCGTDNRCETSCNPSGPTLMEPYGASGFCGRIPPFNNINTLANISNEKGCPANQTVNGWAMQCYETHDKWCGLKSTHYADKNRVLLWTDTNPNIVTYGNYYFKQQATGGVAAPLIPGGNPDLSNGQVQCLDISGCADNVKTIGVAVDCGVQYSGQSVENCGPDYKCGVFDMTGVGFLPDYTCGAGKCPNLPAH